MDKLVIRNTGSLHGLFYGDDGRELVYGKDFEKFLNAIKKHSSKIKKVKDRKGNIEFIFEDTLIVLDHKGNFENDKRFNYIFELAKKRKYKLMKIKAAGIVIGVMITTPIAINAGNNNDSKTPDTSVTQVDDVDNSEEIEIELENHEIENAKPTKPNVKYEDKEKEKSDEITNDDIREMLSIPDQYEQSKLENTKKLYYNLICKYANKYGVDPDLMCAIATQESGVHSYRLSKYGNGLFQIEGCHIGETIRPYNYETGKRDVIKITNDSIVDLETNIQLGCAFLQQGLEKFDGNVLMAIKAYNVGLGAMSSMLSAYCYDSGKSKETVIKDKTNIKWDNYHTSRYGGDKEYLQHVLRFYQGDLKKLILGDNAVKTK